MLRIDTFPLFRVFEKNSGRRYPSLSSSAYTIFLFIKSDIKTILIPNSLFAFATAPLSLDSSSLLRATQVVFWIFLHLLQFNVSNQYIPSSVEEDARNKPYRPIPSGRISIADAWLLRWTLLPLCLTYSLTFSTSVAMTSLFLSGFTLIHNELGGGSGWAIRNILNGLGYASFATGALLLAGPNRHTLDEISLDALCISAALITTTIHAQDFKDVEGDAKAGRSTLPMVLQPFVARTSLHMLILGWSILLTGIWEINGLLAKIYLGLAAGVGMKFVLWRSVRDDQTSYYLYNLWLSITFMLPAYNRFKVDSRNAVA